MCTSTTGHSHIFSASRMATRVVQNAAGLMTMPAAYRASCSQPSTLVLGIGLARYQLQPVALGHRAA